MDKRYSIAILVLIVLGLGAWALVSHLNSLKVDPAVVEQLNWKLVDQGVDKDTQGTTTRVFLTVAGVDVPIGGYRGACSLIDASTTPLLAGEVSGVICTREKTGKEVGIFNQSGKLVLMEGDVELNADGSFAKRDNFIKRNEL